MMCWYFPERALRITRLATLLLVLAAGISHAACGDGLTKPRVLQGLHHQLAYAFDPAAIVLGKHFALQVVACPTDGTGMPDSLEVDARMLEHGHGMSYQPRASRTAPGQWRVEGLKLHMKGHWTLRFDVGAASQAERIEDVLHLK